MACSSDDRAHRAMIEYPQLSTESQAKMKKLRKIVNTETLPPPLFTVGWGGDSCVFTSFFYFFVVVSEAMVTYGHPPDRRDELYHLSYMPYIYVHKFRKY